jgi:hypothetical protein
VQRALQTGLRHSQVYTIMFELTCELNGIYSRCDRSSRLLTLLLWRSRVVSSLQVGSAGTSVVGRLIGPYASCRILNIGLSGTVLSTKVESLKFGLLMAVLERSDKVRGYIRCTLQKVRTSQRADA